MYAKRYLRLLVAVAVFFTVLVLIVISTDYPLTDLSTLSSSSGSNSGSGSKNIDSILASASKDHSSTAANILGLFIPSFIKPKPKHPSRPKKIPNSVVENYDVINTFPLNNSLLDMSLYSPTELTTFSDPAKYIRDKSTDYEFVKQDMCRNLRFTGDFKLTKQQYLEADFASIQRALDANPEYKKIIEVAKATFPSSLPEQKQWFRFGGSSVWLPQFEVHYMVSRVFYSPSGIPNKSFVSFLYVQLFDSNWKEIPHRKLKIPYVQNVFENRLNADGSVYQNILDKTVAFREVDYPAFLPIPVEYLTKTENNKYYYGPEDPRILIRNNPLGFHEPLVVFNMKSVKLSKRVMNRYLPFSHDLTVLKKRDEPWAKIEKNWTPFISSTNTSSPDGTGINSVQYINFIYSIDPLEILTCEVDTGICDFLQKPQKDDYNYIGPLRGGTQLVKLPLDDMIPQHVADQLSLPENRQVYVGWARAHLNQCGCGESMYRPNLIAMVEDYNPQSRKFYYKLADVSEYFDFGAHVPPWTTPKLDGKGQLIEESNTDKQQCVGRNVLIPNSIAYWNIDAIIKDKVSYKRKYFHKIPTNEQLDDKKASKVMKVANNNGKKAVKDKRYSTNSYPVYFDDFMGVTLSAADADVSIVHVRGLLNYILNLPSLYDESTMVQDDSMFQPRGYTFNNECAMDASHDYCVRYAEANGGVTKYEKSTEQVEKEQKDELVKAQKAEKEKEKQKGN